MDCLPPFVSDGPVGMPDATVSRNSSAAHELLRKWDLGTKRSLDQLIDFTGVDTRNYNVFKSTCNKVQWVPFEEWSTDQEGWEDNGDPMILAYHGKPPPIWQRMGGSSSGGSGEGPSVDSWLWWWQYALGLGMISILVFIAFLLLIRRRSKGGIGGPSSSSTSPHEALLYPLVRQFSPEKTV